MMKRDSLTSLTKIWKPLSDRKGRADGVCIFSTELWAKGIHKFRVSQEIRCFGYREGDKFHLLRIDLDHVLSDKG